jgi:hypothetical protein
MVVRRHICDVCDFSEGRIEVVRYVFRGSGREADCWLRIAIV